MNRTEKWSILTRLILALRKAGSWTGETHLQKATFFLQELAQVPLGFNFILYKHGPFSFDLSDELGLLKGAGVVVPEPQGPYGAKLKATRTYSVSFAMEFGRRIQFTADHLGSLGVAELERLGTALLLHRENPSQQLETLAGKLCEAKPHVTEDQARDAFESLRRLLKDRQQMQSQTALELARD